MSQQHYNISKLEFLYEMSKGTMHRMLLPHRSEIDKVATYYTTIKNGKKIKVKRNELNLDQLQYIVKEVLGFPPGYTFNGTEFIKNK